MNVLGRLTCVWKLLYIIFSYIIGEWYQQHLCVFISVENISSMLSFLGWQLPHFFPRAIKLLFYWHFYNLVMGKLKPYKLVSFFMHLLQWVMNLLYNAFFVRFCKYPAPHLYSNVMRNECLVISLFWSHQCNMLGRIVNKFGKNRI